MAEEPETADAEIVLVAGFTIGDLMGQLVGLQMVKFEASGGAPQSSVYGMTPDQAEDLAKHLYLTAGRVRQGGGPPPAQPN